MSNWIRKADDQLKMGVEVEKEHAGTYKWIKDTYEKTGKWPEPPPVARATLPSTGESARTMQ